MSFSSTIEKTFKTLLPAPFTIAVVLTILTMLLAFGLTSSEESGLGRIVEVLGFWEKGLWNAPLLVFAMQMMLMLVLGHALALTKPVDSVISYATRFCNNTANAAAIVTFLTVLVALFNWGLGLIFGAILARKVGEHAVRNDLDINYPLIGASGYSGLMVWHGGISGSAPIKVAEEGHIHSLMSDIVSPEKLTLLPDPVSFSETVFGTMNLVTIPLLIIVLPAFMFLMGKRSPISSYLPISKSNLKLDSIRNAFGWHTSTPVPPMSWDRSDTGLGASRVGTAKKKVTTIISTLPPTPTPLPPNPPSPLHWRERAPRLLCDCLRPPAPRE